jgi:two-component system response regulator HydG
MSPDKLHSVLIVDDDSAMRSTLCSMLDEENIESIPVSSAEEAMEFLRGRDVTAIISDIRMPGKSGIELLGEIRELRPSTPVILMTAFGRIDTAVEAMQLGAFHYITKPFKRKEALITLERAFEYRLLADENTMLRRAVAEQTSSCGDLLGESPAMREIFSVVRKVAINRSTVLITGESGTGKEVLARAIHFSSHRASEAFIPVNCSALPENLLESELFGHIRGAFTGAHIAKKGLFEEANDGTLFLDEIGDISPLMQAKLLRVLQDGEVRPVGATRSIRTDVRLIAATNRDLRKRIETGDFREDLYYRLSVIPIHIPPLRERPEDVRVLAEAFLRRHESDPRQRLTPAAIKKLEGAPWKGNGRELENAIERAITLADHLEIDADAFPFLDDEELTADLPQGNLFEDALEDLPKLQELEDRYIAEILKRTSGNKMHAARILGIDRRTLYRRYEDLAPYLEDADDEPTGLSQSEKELP